MSTNTKERAALERIVTGAFRELTGRGSEPLRYAMMTDTPVGVLGLAIGAQGLCRLSFVKDEEHFLRRLLDEFADRPVFPSNKLDQVRRELDRYFAGKKLTFDVPVDLSLMHGFSLKVLEQTARIPVGQVRTYTEVAGKAGNKRASRAAGNALHNNPIAIVVPCHRVLRSDGSLGGYGGGLPVKEWLLQHEGATLL